VMQGDQRLDRSTRFSRNALRRMSAGRGGRFVTAPDQPRNVTAGASNAGRKETTHEEHSQRSRERPRQPSPPRNCHLRSGGWFVRSTNKREALMIRERRENAFA
jgi:hypothetical protein